MCTKERRKKLSCVSLQEFVMNSRADEINDEVAEKEKIKWLHKNLRLLPYPTRSRRMDSR